MRVDHPCMVFQVSPSFRNENDDEIRESTVVQASLAGWGKLNVEVASAQRISGESKNENGESCEFVS